MRVQVAFQGGGARIAALLAAAEAIRACRELEVTRVAGTSAGAIAALIFASGAEIPGVREALLQRGDKGIARLFPPRCTLRQFWIAARGNPLYDIDELRKLLKELLKGHVDDRTTLGGLPIPTFITVTDAASGEKKVLKDDDGALRAVVDSSALPFVFRHSAALKDNAHLDGGLCENLPTSELRKEQSYGEVIAVSFKPDDPELPSGPLALAARMLDLSIQNSVHRAIQDIGKANVHEISTQLTTFDFSNVCAKGLHDDPYGRVRAETREWLDTWVKGRTKSKRQVATELPSHEMESRVGAIYSMLRSEVVVVRSTMIVVAHEFAAPEQANEVFNLRRLKPKAELRCWISSLGSSGEHETEGEWAVTDSAGTMRDDFIAVPARTGRVDDMQTVALFFRQPLPADVEHEISRSSRMSGVFKNIHEGKTEFLSHTNTEHLEVLESHIILVVPNDWRVTVQFGGQVGGRDLLPAEMRRLYAGYVQREGMKAIGWQTNNLRQGTTFEVTFHAEKSR